MINTANESGAQRLSLEALRQWEAMKYGMFIHYGMSTYTGEELPDGNHPRHFTRPTSSMWINGSPLPVMPG